MKSKQLKNIDNEKIKEFIHILFSPGDTINISRIEEPEPENRKAKIQSRNFKFNEWPEISNLKNQGVFICANPLKPDTKRAEINIKKLKTIFVDFDNVSHSSSEMLNNLKKIGLTPNIISKRSETNQHFYYLIEPEKPTSLNILKYKAIVNYFIENFRADKLVKNPAGLIRLPETIRYKDNDKNLKYKYEIIHENKLTLDDFIEILNINIIEDIGTEIKNVKQKIENFDPENHIKNRIIKLYEQEKYQTGTKETEETLVLYRLGLECRDWGIENEQALKIAFDLNDIIFEPPVKDHIVKHQINSAYLYARNESGTRLKEWDEQGDLKAQKKYLSQVYEEERVRDKLKDYSFVLKSMVIINKKRYSESYSGKEHFAAFLNSKINTSLGISKIKLKGLIHIVDKMDFRPDILKQEFVDIDGLSCLNRYTGIPFDSIYQECKSTINNNIKKLNIFLEHIKYLTNNEYEYKTLISYFAHKLQKPEIKIPWTPLLISTQTGTGRSWLAVLFEKFFGDYWANVTHKNLKFGYTQYKTDKLFIAMHEIKDSENFSFLESFKEQITETRFLVDEKYSRSYWMTDCINYLFFSNHFDALRIDNTDRRLFVILNMKGIKPQDYYDKLYGLLNDEEALVLIYDFLINFDLSDFNPYQRPDITEGKKLMIETTATELYLFLDEMRNDPDNNIFKHNIIIGRDIQNYIQMNGSELIRKRVSEKQIKLYLLKNGFMEYDLNRKICGERIHRRVWLKDVTPETLKEKSNEITKEEIIKVLGLEFSENKEENVDY